MDPQTLSRLEITFHVAGTPLPEPRPRFRKGGHVHAGTSADPWKASVRQAAARAVFEAQRGAWPTDMPVAVEIRLVMPGSKPWARPDGDNMEKAVLDALGSSTADRWRWAPILWTDDALVVDCHWRKFAGSSPGATVRVWLVDPQEYLE